MNSEGAGATTLSTSDEPFIEIGENMQNGTLFEQVQYQLQEQAKNAAEAAAALKAAFVNALGESLVESFNFRTCVEPTLTLFSNGNEYKIRYKSLTADLS